MPRYIDADRLLRNTIYNPNHVPYIAESDIIFSPPANVVEQKRGKWIATQEWGGRNYSCSCCNFCFMVDTCMYEPMWNYCPNCGAKMDGERREDGGR